MRNARIAVLAMTCLGALAVVVRMGSRSPDSAVGSPSASEMPFERDPDVVMPQAAPRARIAPQPARELGISYRGRVVEHDRAPVEGAEVSLASHGIGTFSCYSAADGSFSIDGVPALRCSESGTVRARMGERSAARPCDLYAANHAPAWMQGPGICDVGTLVLGDAHTLPVHVTYRGHAQQGAHVVAYAGSSDMAVAETDTDALGLGRVAPLPAGWLRVEARTSEAAVTADAFLPDPEVATLELDLRDLCAVEILVRDARSGSPVASADVTVDDVFTAPFVRGVDGTSRSATWTLAVPVAVPATDADGRTIAAGLQAGRRYKLTAWLPGLPTVTHAASRSVVIDTGTETSKVIEVDAGGRSVSWTLVPNHPRNPPNGTVLRLAPAAPMLTPDTPARRRWLERWEGMTAEVVGGRLVLEGARLPVQVITWSAAGDIAIAYTYDGVPVEPLEFHPPRKLVVTVLDSVGSHASGVRVDVRAQSLKPPYAHESTFWTNDDGTCCFTDLFPGRADIGVAGSLGARVSSQVTLSEETTHVTAQLPPYDIVRLQPVVAGQPCLPAEYWTWAWHGSGFEPLQPLVEDPTAKTFDVALSPPPDGAPIFLLFDAEGFLTVSQRVSIPGDLGRPIVLPLERACQLSVHVAPVAQAVELVLLSASSTGEVIELDHPGLVSPNGPSGSFLFRQLSAGTYRVRDNVSAAVSDPVTLDPSSSASAYVRLDTGFGARVCGRIIAPPGTRMSLVRVLVWQEGLSEPSDPLAEEGPACVQVEDDGSFCVNVPRGSAQLRAWHPFLKSPESTDVAPVDLSGVELRLVEGDMLKVPIPSGVAVDQPTLHRFQPGVRGAYQSSHRGVDEGGVAMFGDVPPGSWTFWLDFGHWNDQAPSIIENALVEPGIAVLPEPMLERGSAVRLLFELTAAAPDEITAYACRIEPPFICRRATSSPGSSVVELSGLPAGSYRLSVSYSLRTFDLPVPPLVVDGHNDREMTVDL
jgi:hypothetical protein